LGSGFNSKSGSRLGTGAGSRQAKIGPLKRKNVEISYLKSLNVLLRRRIGRFLSKKKCPIINFLLILSK
jgi:hypothetical protein